MYHLIEGPDAIMPALNRMHCDYRFQTVPGVIVRHRRKRGRVQQFLENPVNPEFDQFRNWLRVELDTTEEGRDLLKSLSYSPIAQGSEE